MLIARASIGNDTDLTLKLRINVIAHEDRGWHIANRCGERESLLKFGRDRQRWVQWLSAVEQGLWSVHLELHGDCRSDPTSAA
jgi:hypothetical protein